MEFYKIIDNITARFLVFLLNAVWIQYFVRNVLASLVIAFSLTLLTFVVAKKAMEKVPHDKIDKSEIYKSFVLMRPDDLKKRYLSLSNDENFVKCAMRFSNASIDDVASAYRESDGNPATLLVGNATRSVFVFASSLEAPVKIVTKKDLYKLFKANNALPEIKTKPAEKPPLNLKEILKATFSPKNAKFFLFSAVLLSLTAFFTPFKLYYAIMASVSIVFSLVSTIRGIREN